MRIEACGLCHTDIHAARGEWPVKPRPPFIPGHEGVGIIERVGPGNAHGLEEGMRVALPWLGYACGDCRYCNSGAETLCESQINTGYGMNGGFAEYARRLRPPRRACPRRRRPARRRAADLRGRHDLQGGQGLGRLLRRAGRGVRRRRPRPPGDPVRAHHGRRGRRRRHQRGAAEHRARARRRARRARRRTGPGRRDPGARRRRPGDLDRRQPVGLRAGARLARARRHARLRRAARARTRCACRSSRRCSAA